MLDANHQIVQREDSFRRNRRGDPDDNLLRTDRRANGDVRLASLERLITEFGEDPLRPERLFAPGQGTQVFHIYFSQQIRNASKSAASVGRAAVSSHNGVPLTAINRLT